MVSGELFDHALILGFQYIMARLFLEVDVSNGPCKGLRRISSWRYMRYDALPPSGVEEHEQQQ